MTAVFVLVVVGFFARELVRDGGALLQRKDPPSMEKWRARRADKQQRGQQAEANHGYLKRIAGNALESWAEASDRRHQRKQAWLAEKEPTASADWLERKRRNFDKARARREKFAKARGVVLDRTRQAAEAVRERRAEDQAHRRNTTEPDLPDSDEHIDAWIDEHGRGHPSRSRSEHGQGGELPVVYDDDGTAYYVGEDGSRTRVPPEPLGKEDALDDLDEQPDPDNVVPFQRPETHQIDQEDTATTPTDQDPDATFVTHPSGRGVISKGELHRQRDLDDADRAAAENQAQREHEATENQAQRDHEYRLAQLDQQLADNDQTDQTDQTASNVTTEVPTMTEPTDNTAAEATYETTSLTATLARTQASADACASQVSVWDQRKAEHEREAAALTTQIAGIETQIAALRQRDNAGDEIARLSRAQEQLAAARDSVTAQAAAAATVLQAYQAAGSEFGQAHAGFQQQVTGQEFYAAHAGAGNKEFLTQG